MRDVTVVCPLMHDGNCHGAAIVRATVGDHFERILAPKSESIGHTLMEMIFQVVNEWIEKTDDGRDTWDGSAHTFNIADLADVLKDDTSDIHKFFDNYDLQRLEIEVVEGCPTNYRMDEALLVPSPNSPYERARDLRRGTVPRNLPESPNHRSQMEQSFIKFCGEYKLDPAHLAQMIGKAHYRKRLYERANQREVTKEEAAALDARRERVSRELQEYGRKLGFKKVDMTTGLWVHVTLADGREIPLPRLE